MTGYWNTDWWLPKPDEKEFYEIEKKDGNLIINSSAHFGFQNFRKYVIFRKKSH